MKLIASDPFEFPWAKNVFGSKIFGNSSFGFYKNIIKKDGFVPDEKHIQTETIYVLSGKMLVKIEDKEYNLVQNETIHIESNKQHRIENAGNEDLVLLIVASPDFEC